MSEERPCPTCGEPVEPRQLVCLNCGGRVALAERRSWANEPVTAIAAALMAVIVIGAGLFGFAIAELTGDDGDDGGRRRRRRTGPGAARLPLWSREKGRRPSPPPAPPCPPTDRTETTPGQTVPTETAPAATAESGDAARLAGRV